MPISQITQLVTDKLKYSHAILAIGFVVTALAYIFVYDYEREILNKEFYRHANQYTKSIEYETLRGIELLDYFNAHIKTNPPNAYSDFSLYSTEILKTHPEVLGLAWIPNINHAQRHLTELSMQKDLPEFIFTELQEKNIIKAKTRDTYYPIQFISPYIPYKNLFGFDLNSIEPLAYTLTRARDTGTIQLTSKTDIFPNNGNSTDTVLAIKPVYQHNSTLKTFQQRRKHHIGFLAGFFHLDNIFNAAHLHQYTKYLSVHVIDLNNSEHESSVYRSNHSSTSSTNELVYRHTITIGERSWLLQVTPNTGFYEIRLNTSTALVLVMGITITIMSFIYIQSTQNKLYDLKKMQVKLKHANQELTRLSKFDSNLNIANRSYFDEYIESEWKRAIRSGHPVSLIMADVDYFKNYNDYYGHIVGDECLREVANHFTILAARPADLVARYGGEEIAVVMPETTFNGTKHIAAAIRKSIELAAIPHQHSPASSVVTISIGHGTIIPTSNDELIDFIHIIDKQLYLAKQLGRNQVCSIDLTQPKQNRVIASLSKF